MIMAMLAIIIVSRTDTLGSGKRRTSAPPTRRGILIFQILLCFVKRFLGDRLNGTIKAPRKKYFFTRKNMCVSSRRKGGAKFVPKGNYSRSLDRILSAKLMRNVCFFQVFVYASQNRVSFLVNVEVLIVLQSPKAFNYPIQREWLDLHVSGKNVFLSNQSRKPEH